MKKFLISLLTNNTGVSIKNYLLFWISIIITIVLLVVLSFEWYLLKHPNVDYHPDYIGISAIITAFGTMAAGVIYGKIKDNGFGSSDFGRGINKEDGI